MREKRTSCHGCKALSLDIKTREHACYYGNAIENDSHQSDCFHPKTWKAFKQGVIAVYGTAKVKREDHA